MTMRKVTVQFGKNVPAYASTTINVDIADDASLEKYLTDNAGDLMGDLVFAPDWQQSDGERIVEASDGTDVVHDIPLGPQALEDSSSDARQLVRQHWPLLSQLLPAAVLAQFQAILDGARPQPCVDPVQAPSAPLRVVKKVQPEDIRVEVEQGLAYLRSVIEEPVKVQYSAHVWIEVQPDNEGPLVTIMRPERGDTVVNYTHDGLVLDVYRGGDTVQPVLAARFERRDIEDELNGLISHSKP